MKPAWRWGLFTLALSLSAGAETHRLAVVVGNNAGNGERAPLRFAESDAGKMARVLVELGGVAEDDVFLLQGRGLEMVKQALSVAAQRVAQWHRRPSNRVVLLFYFSGHSDGTALELGPERLPFDELKKWLEPTGAEVRVAIIDSCKSGALLAKGARLAPAFQIGLDDELSSTGQAVLTSSAEDELALESSEIGGSFFTHHFLSGLRGAADTSGDGQVTLAEAYEYAFVHTVTATSSARTGGQHPIYGYRLSGRGELVLTQLERPSGQLVLPPGFERALVIQLLRDQVLAEVPAGAASRLAVPPGDYAVRLWKGGALFDNRFHVREGESIDVKWADLMPAAQAATVGKGGALAQAVEPPPRSPVVTLHVAGGVRAAVAAELNPMAMVELGVGSASTWGWTVRAQAGQAMSPRLTERAFALAASYRFGVRLWRFEMFAAPELGAVLNMQDSSSGFHGWSLSPALGAFLGAAVALSSRWSLSLEGHLPVCWVKGVGPTQVSLQPTVSLGVGWAL
jgi:hypothetical protein